METSLLRPFDEAKFLVIRSERNPFTTSITAYTAGKPVSINSQTVIKNAQQQSASREKDKHLENPMTKNNNTEPRQQTITNCSH